jgi:hypothetical protein
MAITKFTVSENVEASRQKEQEAIRSFVKKAGKTSVEELTDTEKENLQNTLTK